MPSRKSRKSRKSNKSRKPTKKRQQVHSVIHVTKSPHKTSTVLKRPGDLPRIIERPQKNPALIRKPGGPPRVAAEEMSITDLQMLAKSRGIPFGGLSKAKLIKRINAYPSH